jgi:hypothetical protein
MNDEFERIWKEVVLVYSMYYPCICLKGLRKRNVNHSQYRWHPKQGFKPSTSRIPLYCYTKSKESSFLILLSSVIWGRAIYSELPEVITGNFRGLFMPSSEIQYESISIDRHRLSPYSPAYRTEQDLYLPCVWIQKSLAEELDCTSFVGV